MSGDKLKRLSTKPAKREPLNDGHKQIVFALLCRNTSFFLAAKDQLDTERDLAGEENRKYALIWESLRALYEKFEKLPSYDGLFAELNRRLNRDPDFLEDDAVEEVSVFLRKTYDRNRKNLKAMLDEGREYLRQLLHEGLQEQLRQEVDAEESEIVSDLPTFLTSMHERAAQIDSIAVGTVKDLWDDDDEDQAIVKTSTGCTFLDEYMGGGHAEGEIYGLMAPWGVCKTTLACQLAVNRALQVQAIWNERGRTGKLPVVYMVFYEEPRKSVRVRLESFAAQIERKILESRDFKNFSSRKLDNYKDYEKSMFRGLFEAGGRPPGELERYNAARRQLKRNVKVINFVGDDPQYRLQASTMTTGIIDVIREDQRKSGNPGVASVIIDYAGAAAVRHLSANPHKEATKEMRHLIGRMPLDVKVNICAAMKTHAWLVHQLSTEANSRAPGTSMKITDAAEARNFPEHCDFAFLVGTKTDDGLTVLTAAKQRREEKKKDTVIRVDGRFCAVRSTDNEFLIENNRIVSAKEFSRVADTTDDEEEVTLDNEYDSLQ
jgi:hypothetical protein